MSLYLCVFDGDEEVEGVEVGPYSDFNMFRDAVTATVEKGKARSVCPVLINHSDCDGVWSAAEARALLAELDEIEAGMEKHPPVELSAQWQRDVAKTFGIKPKNLRDCFFDIDGEPLIARLRSLEQASVKSNSPILFQ